MAPTGQELTIASISGVNSIGCSTTLALNVVESKAKIFGSKDAQVLQPMQRSWFITIFFIINFNDNTNNRRSII